MSFAFLSYKTLSLEQCFFLHISLLRTHTLIYACVYVYVPCMHVCMYACMHVTHIHAGMFTRICTNTCVSYLYVCIDRKTESETERERRRDRERESKQQASDCVC